MVKNRTVAVVVCSLLAALALVLLYAFTLNPGKERIKRIVQCNPKDVRAIVLLPLESQASLVAEPVAIDNRAAIDDICQSLHCASRLLPNHPSIQWEVKVLVSTDKEDLSFVVFRAREEDNGTIVSVMSDVTSGWNYGSLRSDSLGPILEGLAKNAKAPQRSAEQLQ